MLLYVIEARNAQGTIIGRAEFDNAKDKKRFWHEFQQSKNVQTMRLLADEVETEKWER